MPIPRHNTVATTLGCLIAILLPAVAHAASAYAPLNHPGPPLSVPARSLRAALSCPQALSPQGTVPVLMIPGTNLDPPSNYAWNYERAFAARHQPFCTVTLPYHTMGDIQVAGEYVVYAIRTMAARAHRRINLLGYSQGGMLPRWGLRFWPDTRRLVGDYVAIDPSNHGTVAANATCQGKCAPADWQQAADSHFIQALNSGVETFAGIDYTVIYSRADEIVVPNSDSSGSSSLHTGAGRIVNIRVQDICPADTSEHLAMGSYDAVAYALAIDAYTHGGTALGSRIPASVCAEPYQPGVNGSTFAADYTGYLSAVGHAQQVAPQTTAEPPLRCYVFARCPTLQHNPAGGKRPRRATHRASGGKTPRRTTHRAGGGRGSRRAAHRHVRRRRDTEDR